MIGMDGERVRELCAVCMNDDDDDDDEKVLTSKSLSIFFELWVWLHIIINMKIYYDPNVEYPKIMELAAKVMII